jgi:membrane-associated phospholipid phosphatase
MSSNPSFSVTARGHPHRRLAQSLALAVTLGIASTGAAVTIPLHIADAPPEGFADSLGLLRAEPEALGLGADPGALGTPSVASHDTPAPAAPFTAAGAPSQTSMPSLAAFPGQVGRDFVHLLVRPVDFDAQDWTRFAVGAGAVGLVAIFDTRIRNTVRAGGTSGSTRFAKGIRPFGTWGGLAVMGVALAGGQLFHDPNLASMGLDGIEASLFTGVIIVPALKKITGRERPNAGEGPSDFGFFSTDQSFPSGEAALAFTNAAVIAQHTDSVVVRGIAWGLAGLVGWERMRVDAHWASDVVAGALIGTAVGSWVAKIHRPAEATAHTTVSVLPTLGPRALGVTASISW